MPGDRAVDADDKDSAFWAHCRDEVRAGLLWAIMSTWQDELGDVKPPVQVIVSHQLHQDGVRDLSAPDQVMLVFLWVLRCVEGVTPFGYTAEYVLLCLHCVWPRTLFRIWPECQLCDERRRFHLPSTLYVIVGDRCKENIGAPPYSTLWRKLQRGAGKICL